MNQINYNSSSLFLTKKCRTHLSTNKIFIQKRYVLKTAETSAKIVPPIVKNYFAETGERAIASITANSVRSSTTSTCTTSSIPATTADRVPLANDIDRKVQPKIDFEKVNESLKTSSIQQQKLGINISVRDFYQDFLLKPVTTIVENITLGRALVVKSVGYLTGEHPNQGMKEPHPVAVLRYGLIDEKENTELVEGSVITTHASFKTEVKNYRPSGEETFNKTRSKTTQVSKELLLPKYKKAQTSKMEYDIEGKELPQKVTPATLTREGENFLTKARTLEVKNFRHLTPQEIALLDKITVRKILLLTAYDILFPEEKLTETLEKVENEILPLMESFLIDEGVICNVDPVNNTQLLPIEWKNDID